MRSTLQLRFLLVVGLLLDCLMTTVTAFCSTGIVSSNEKLHTAKTSRSLCHTQTTLSNKRLFRVSTDVKLKLSMASSIHNNPIETSNKRMATTKSMPILDRSWEEKYGKLLDFRDKTGHCNVPARYKEDPAFGNWVAHQRQLAKKRKLDKQKQQKLNEIGFSWSSTIYNEQWQESYEKLLKYKAKHGHCHVPQKYKEDPALGGWAARQSCLAKTGKLDKQRQQKLNAIGFTWSSTTANEKWKESYEKLLEYKAKNGHCNVPALYKQDPKLGNWVAHQRRFEKKGKLHKQRQQKLNAVGFSWSSTIEDEWWQESYDKLVDFKAKHGHCHVPQKYKEDPSLGNWVAHQRQLAKKGKLDKQRQQKLNAVCFTWSSTIHNELWQESYEKLLKYKAKHGHCNVPARYKEDLKLGSWVAHQRHLAKKGKLDKQRQEKLNEIGFRWEKQC